MRKLFISTILGLTITGGADASIVSRGFFEEQIGNYATLDLLNSKANQKDLTALSNKIGILPDDITVQAMLEGWTNSNGDFLPGLFMYSVGEVNVQNSYDGQNTARLLITGAKATTIDNVDYTGPVYPLWKLSEGIDKIASIEPKIGTLPSGVAPMLSRISEDFNSLHTIFPVDATYPQSLEELIIDLYGDTSANHPGILAILFGDTIDILWGHEYEIYGNDHHTGLFDRTSAIESRTGAIERQIGTLPAGYDSVGAALTAIKGIAEDAKTAALAAIPDPKQEGSSGKFVLTVDIVGDNATYRWEKIDREGETTTTTTE